MDPRRIGRLAASRLAPFAPSGVGDEQLRAILTQHGYVPHDAALAFDRVWAGLQLEEHTVGAGLCAESHERGDPVPGLIPVVLSDNDNYYFLAPDGAAWAQDGIEDPEPVPFAADGDRAVALIVLYGVSFDRRLDRLAVDLHGARGLEIANLLGVPAIPEASDAITRTWGDDRVLIFERDGETMVACATAELLARVPR